MSEFDELPFKIELWQDDDLHVQKTLARVAKITHAHQFILAIRHEFIGRSLLLRQRSKALWP